MSRFDRKVERTKKEYQFTKKKEEPVKKSLLKDNLNLKWIKLNIPTVIGLMIDFLISTLVVLPLLMTYFDSTLAFVLGHGCVTGLLIVITVYLVKKEKPKLSEFIVRYLFIGVILGLASYLSIVITAWLN